MDAQSEKDIGFLESLASLYRNDYSENSASANFNLFSQSEIKQLDTESESREEDIRTPPENKSTSKTELKEEIGHGMFSKKLFTDAEISLFPDEILFKTENQQFDEVKAVTKVVEHKESEKEVDPQENLASLFSHELTCSPDLVHLPVIESQEVDKENEGEEENTVTPLVNVVKFSSSNVSSMRSCEPCSVLTIVTEKGRERRKSADLEFKNDLSVEPVVIENKEVTKSVLIGLDAAEEAFTPDKENWSSNTRALRSMQCKSSSWESNEDMSNNLFTALSENGEQFTPDKENMTPNTLIVRSMVKLSRMKYIKGGSNLHVSSSVDGVLFSSFEEIPASKLVQKRKLTTSSSGTLKVKKLKSGTKKSPAGRVPFRTVFEDVSNTSKSEPPCALSSAAKSCNAFNLVGAIEIKGNIREDKRKWRMVVDTNCLLDKESRKALQLLQGLKGTQMIIPRIVIRELDSMKRRGSLFKRKTEASYALEWIEDCMTNTDWWIHVESWEEEATPIAPTLPAHPESRFSKVYRKFSGGAASSIFSTWRRSLCEIVPSTAGDHVLDCALQFRANTSDGKFVLLSNDVALKIKSMAEGLICETAQEFRDSLVNPFSYRFLWSDSSPRGLTWSCKDDTVLEEFFYGHSMKLEGKRSAKGLKLILPHHTHPLCSHHFSHW